jgi:hypothetical protein
MCDYNQPCETGLYCSNTLVPGGTGVCVRDPVLWTDRLYQSLNTPYRKWDTTFHKNPTCTFTSLKFNIKDWKMSEEDNVITWSKDGSEYRSTVVSEFPMDLFDSFELVDIITRECSTSKEYHLLWKVIQLPFTQVFDRLDENEIEFLRDEFLEKGRDAFERVNRGMKLPLLNLQDHLVFEGSLDGDYSLLLNTVEYTEVDRMMTVEETVNEFKEYLYYLDHSFRFPRMHAYVEDEDDEEDEDDGFFDEVEENVSELIQGDSTFVSKLEEMLNRARMEEL